MTSYNEKITELKQFAIDRMKEINEYKDITRDDSYELFNEIFNTSYYIIGYAKCEEWIGRDTFRMISDIQESEELHFGESTTKLDSSERLVNSWVYWIGYEIFDECYKAVIDELESEDEEDSEDEEEDE